MARARSKEEYDAEPEPAPPSAGEFRGTSIFQGGQVKMASEEARLVVCPDCGRKRGHSRFCSLSK